ncbi:MAG: LPS assembly lipoprotein LptE [Geminicoccaceae bacterium]
MPTKREALNITLASVLLLAAGGCGFRPLLSNAHDDAIRDELAAIQVKGLGGRVGQHLRNALEDNLNPTSLSAPSRYVLAIRLQNTNDALAIQLDNTITRYNLALTAAFQLKTSANQEVIYRSTVRRVASYNVRRAPFSTLTAQKDAERRAAEEIADDIRTLVALHFQRQA